MGVGQYGIIIGGMAGGSLLLHLMSAGNFRPDEEVWFISNLFWYLHYWLNTCARLVLLSVVAIIAMETYMPHTITQYTSVRNSDISKYITKLLGASAACMLLRFILPGPVTSFGIFYKLSFIVSLSATALSVVDSTQYGSTSRRTPSRQDSEKSSEDDDIKRSGKKSFRNLR